jgi:hypothetical protein
VNVGLVLRLGAIVLTCVTCFATSALAVDGVVLIDQARALAGNVTPGDAPGFPVTISASGGYRLSGNLIVPASTNGIEIGSDNVTLDLNGFRIAGTDGTLAGVRTSVGGLRGIAVRNGGVTNFSVGISLGAVFGAEITQVRAFDNTTTGISTGPHSIVTGNTAAGNDRGISIGAGSVASGNNVFENVSLGLQLAANGTAVNNVASANRTGTGFKIFCPAAVIANTAHVNSVDFEVVGGGCTFANNNTPPTP